jgi:hypothetical protein
MTDFNINLNPCDRMQNNIMSVINTLSNDYDFVQKCKTFITNNYNPDVYNICYLYSRFKDSRHNINEIIQIIEDGDDPSSKIILIAIGLGFAMRLHQAYIDEEDHTPSEYDLSSTRHTNNYNKKWITPASSLIIENFVDSIANFYRPWINKNLLILTKNSQIYDCKNFSRETDDLRGCCHLRFAITMKLDYFENLMSTIIPNMIRIGGNVTKISPFLNFSCVN